MKNKPIGIFDSGVGGTSIFKEIHRLLPLEHTIYLADSKNAPYGEKSKSEIVRLSEKNTELLLKMECKIIVVACNTATTNAIDELRKKYKLPFIGIEPAIKPAALKSKTKRVGVLATKGTLSSELFAETSDMYAQHIEIVETVGNGLVEAIESGRKDFPETFGLLQNLLRPMIEKKIDHLVLGCSHYPYLIPQIKKILPPEVKIIDSGEAVARQTKTVLQSLDLLTERQQEPPVFFTNGNPDVLKSLLQPDSYEVSYMDF
jgi:glutamate racemase